MEDGLTIALSPVQLAAILSHHDVTEAETLSNRLLGGLELALGTVELMGATALCLAPDPTLLTKAACVATGAHSMDAINTAAERILVGRATRTATFQAAAALAKQFGASEDTAWKIGLTIDIAVPFAPAMATGAVRIARVRMGHIRLIEHEAIKGLPGGGHTIAKHVGKTPDEMFSRIEKQRASGRIVQNVSVSSFTSLQVAERSISQALKAYEWKISPWAASLVSAEYRQLEFTYRFNQPIGIVVTGGSSQVYQATMLKIVLVRKIFNNQPCYILTAYPVKP